MDHENRGEHDRTVARALRSLDPLTGPTADERQRIRDRILLAFDPPPIPEQHSSAAVEDAPPTRRAWGKPAQARPPLGMRPRGTSWPSLRTRGKPPQATPGPRKPAQDESALDAPPGGLAQAAPIAPTPALEEPGGPTQAKPTPRKRTHGKTAPAEPTHATPTLDAEAHGGPTQAAPIPRKAAQGKHAQAGPTQATEPAHGKPAHSESAQDEPAHGTPTLDAAAHSETALDAAAHSKSAQNEPARSTPTRDAAAQGMSAKDEPTHDAPTRDIRAHGSSAQHTPATRGRLHSKRAQDTPSRPSSGRGHSGPRNRESDRRDAEDGRTGGAARHRVGGGGRRGVLSGVRGRMAVAAMAVLMLVGSLVGMSVLLARDALPGDALYGVKRTAEAASLGLTFGDEPKALKHLEFAAARVTEIETLARRYPNPADAPVGGYLTALTDFDNDTTAGSRQLIRLATSADGRLLESLRDWTELQASRLRNVAGQLPEAAHNREITSRELLDRITTRTDDLLGRMDCYQITSGSFDDIGALPATGRCEKKPAPATGATPPSVSSTTDNSVPATGPETPSGPLPPAEPTPGVPPVPVPGATVSVPAPTTTRPDSSATTTPTTPPLIELPPLLPGLPTLSIG